MKDYNNVEVTETNLEELIRHYASKIEDGLKFVDHQVKTDRDRRLDVLLVDSGGALVVSELKVIEDDGMLLQGIDYYDHISRHLESICRTYERFKIKPDERPRLLLIAPSFSIAFLERCKWISIPLSLYTFQCIKFDKDDDIVPVFIEMNAPSIPKAPPARISVEQVLEYMTDKDMRQTATDFLNEVKSWDKENIAIDAIVDWVSMKYKGRTFGYLGPRRKFFGCQVPDGEGNWPWLTVHTENRENDLGNVKKSLEKSIERIKVSK
jgi:hypothetical protein